MFSDLTDLELWHLVRMLTPAGRWTRIDGKAGREPMLDTDTHAWEPMLDADTHAEVLAAYWDARLEQHRRQSQGC